MRRRAPRARRSRSSQRDVIFAAVADEEAACNQGRLFLVSDHPRKCGPSTRSARSAPSRSTSSGARFYPIQVAEKGISGCARRSTATRATARCPTRKSAVNKLARAVARLSRKRLPMHPTPGRALVPRADRGRASAPAARRAPPPHDAAMPRRSSSTTSCATRISSARSGRCSRTPRRRRSCARGGR